MGVELIIVEELRIIKKSVVFIMLLLLFFVSMLSNHPKLLLILLGVINAYEFSIQVFYQNINDSYLSMSAFPFYLFML